MLRLPNKELPAAAREGLLTLQTQIDGLATYEARVAAAKSEFKRTNTTANLIFREVRSTLEEMTGGHKRCAYCEDSMADEVEHIRPKDLYPEAVFRWSNYLYACGPCNGPKNNGFAIVEDVGGRAVATSVARRRTDPVTPPRAGPAALIDPRRENPLTHLMLDLRDTMLFVPVGADGSESRARGEYTVKLLHLNNRTNLPKAREAHYNSYKEHLRAYVKEKQDGAPVARLRELKNVIHDLSQSHRTVWAEMQRQEADVPELHQLFQAAPEALDW